MSTDGNERLAPAPPYADVLSVYAAVLTIVQAKYGLEEVVPTHRSYLEFPDQQVTSALKESGLNDHEARIFWLGLRTGILSLARTLQLPQDPEPEQST